MIVELTYIRSSDTDSVGRTAARLGERLRNGVETAPGFVVTTDDLAELVEREDLASRLEGVPAEETAALAAEVIAAAELPADLVDDLAESYAALGRDAWVSVQASPTERDLGVSRDVLGPVQGADAVWTLIRQVWASLWAPEAIARREEKAVTDAPDKLAVLVQQAEAPAEPTPAADEAESTAKAEETAPELPLDEPFEAPAADEAAAPEATAEPAEEMGADEGDEENEEAVVAEAELAEDEGRAVEQAEAIADESDPVEAAEVILAEAEVQEMVENEQDTRPVATDAEAGEAPVDEAHSGETPVDETPDSDSRETETAPEPAERVEPIADVADAEPEPAVEPIVEPEPEPIIEPEPEPEPAEAAEAVPGGESEPAAEPAPEILETEAFEEATGDETQEAAEPAGQEEPAGSSRPRTQASGGGSSFTSRTEPSGRSRWIVIGLVSFVLLLLVRRLRRR